MNRRQKTDRGNNGPLLTLLTDFGLEDEYVGVVKGVIFAHAPNARIVDISHLLPPQDVRAASHVLTRTYPYFPPGTVHLAIVDPGVGSTRSILAASADGHYFVGPDNGIFTSIFLKATSLAVHRVTTSNLFLDRVGSTFHGRDIMAPIAARLAAGLALDTVGPKIPAQGCVHVRFGTLVRGGEVLRGEILHVDHFGNLCTNISRREVEGFSAGREVIVKVGGNILVPICRSYADRAIGEFVALYDSHDHLEIAVNQGNAAKILNMTAGSTLCLTLASHEPGSISPAT